MDNSARGLYDKRTKWSADERSIVSMWEDETATDETIADETRCYQNLILGEKQAFQAWKVGFEKKAERVFS